MLVLFDSIVTCTIVTKFVNYYYVTRKRWMWTARASLSMCGGTRAHQSFSSSLDVMSLLTFALSGESVWRLSVRLVNQLTNLPMCPLKFERARTNNLHIAKYGNPKTHRARTTNLVVNIDLVDTPVVISNLVIHMAWDFVRAGLSPQVGWV